MSNSTSETSSRMSGMANPTSVAPISSVPPTSAPTSAPSSVPPTSVAPSSTPPSSVAPVSTPASSITPSPVAPSSTPLSTATVLATPSTVTQVITAPTQAPSTVLQTSIIIATPSAIPTTSPVAIATSTRLPSSSAERSSATSAAASATSSTPASLQQNGSNNSSHSGLSPGGTIAIAVVIPVVVVALLVLAAIFWWRKRKQRKVAEETRRNEVEEYGYNPNNDPTLPAVAALGGADSPEMTEDSTGYRGWGNNTVSSARKPSTNLSSGIGMAVSDDGRRQSPVSPEHHPPSDGGRSGDPLVDGHNVADGSVIAGSMAATHGSGRGRTNVDAAGIHRGPSNASSSYSAAGRTEGSDDGVAADHGYTNYSEYAPYRPGAAVPVAYDDGAQPVIRDVSARRNTRIENPSVRPQAGNSGIAQNF